MARMSHVFRNEHVLPRCGGSILSAASCSVDISVCSTQRWRVCQEASFASFVSVRLHLPNMEVVVSERCCRDVQISMLLIIVVSILFSIIPIKPQYNPNIRHYGSFHFIL